MIFFWLCLAGKREKLFDYTIHYISRTFFENSKLFIFPFLSRSSYFRQVPFNFWFFIVRAVQLPEMNHGPSVATHNALLAAFRSRNLSKWRRVLQEESSLTKQRMKTLPRSSLRHLKTLKLSLLLMLWISGKIYFVGSMLTVSFARFSCAFLNTWNISNFSKKHISYEI